MTHLQLYEQAQQDIVNIAHKTGLPVHEAAKKMLELRILPVVKGMMDEAS